jgi:hypothetical protein
MMSKLASGTLLGCAACFALTQPAHAYLDPGTGSMVLQGIIGGIAGGLFLLKTRWAAIRQRFSRQDARPDIRE